MLLLASRIINNFPYLGYGVVDHISDIGTRNNMLDKKTKQRIINRFKVHDNDTGSTQVQVAILTEEIKQLVDHLKSHKQDYSSRRGLLKMVSQRRSLLDYVKSKDEARYRDLIKRLGIRR